MNDEIINAESEIHVPETPESMNVAMKNVVANENIHDKPPEVVFAEEAIAGILPYKTNANFENNDFNLISD